MRTAQEAEAGYVGERIDMSNAHRDQVILEIVTKLNDLQTSYDSALLTAALIGKAAFLSNLLRAAGVTTSKDIVDMFEHGIQIATGEPLHAPRIVYLNGGPDTKQ